MLIRPKTIADLIHNSRCNTNRFLSVYSNFGEDVHIDDFVKYVYQCADMLRAEDVKKGDRVAIKAYNSIEWAIIDYACHVLGAIVVPIYSTLPEDQVGFILKDSGAKIIFTDDDCFYVIKTMYTHSLYRYLNKSSQQSHFNNFTTTDIKEDDIATIIYTSGTTGIQKGVVLTHKNIISNVLACSHAIQCDSKDMSLSFLPLAHSFQRIVDYIMFYNNVSIAYCDDINNVANCMKKFKPTIMAAVPRFYEKIYNKINELDGIKGSLIRWCVRSKQSGGIKSYLADKLLGIVRKQVGGKIRFFISGGSALMPHLSEFFEVIGLPIVKGYGLTEASPVVTLDRLNNRNHNSVGIPIDGVNVAIAHDGEILVNGSNVMSGYWMNDAETSKMLSYGWLYTGDIGKIENGHLYVIDRKKDLFKTSYGKYIAPQYIENLLKFNGADDAVIIGDNRQFVTALVVSDKNVDEIIRKVNKILPNHEQIKKFRIIPNCTIESGCLTPTMKIKRRVICEKYKNLIEEMYGNK